MFRIKRIFWICKKVENNLDYVKNLVYKRNLNIIILKRVTVLNQILFYYFLNKINKLRKQARGCRFLTIFRLIKKCKRMSTPSFVGLKPKNPWAYWRLRPNSWFVIYHMKQCTLDIIWSSLKSSLNKIYVRQSQDGQKD